MVVLFWTSSMLLFMSFMNTASNLRTLDYCIKERFRDGHHSCLRRCVSGNLSCAKLPQSHLPHLLVSQFQVNISMPCQWSFYNTWKWQWLSWVGYIYRWWYSRCWWWNTCWVGCSSNHIMDEFFVMFGPVVTIEAYLAFLVSEYTSWSSRSSHPWWTVMRYMSGHNRSSHTFAACAGMSLVFHPCPTWAAAHHAEDLWSYWKFG